MIGNEAASKVLSKAYIPYHLLFLVYFIYILILNCMELQECRRILFSFLIQHCYHCTLRICRRVSQVVCFLTAINLSSQKIQHTRTNSLADIHYIHLHWVDVDHFVFLAADYKPAYVVDVYATKAVSDSLNGKIMVRLLAFLSSHKRGCEGSLPPTSPII